MPKNRRLAIVFALVATLQTVGPVVLQKSTGAIVYHHALHGAVAFCLMAAVIVAIWQAIWRPFSMPAVAAFVLGLGLLVAFDIWIEYAVDASC